MNLRAIHNIIQFCEEPSPTTPSGGSTYLYLNHSFFFFELIEIMMNPFKIKIQYLK
jgi:hypothetical protein